LPARERDRDLPEHLAAQLRAIDSLSARSKWQTSASKRLADADPVCRRLMTVPGVGAQSALRFTAALDNITRFPDSHRVESLPRARAGRTLQLGKEQRLSITKAGATSVRWLLVQAAWLVRLRVLVGS